VQRGEQATGEIDGQPREEKAPPKFVSASSLRFFAAFARRFDPTAFPLIRQTKA
jgi:hypothetical protein